jgi:hypothetical protein
MTWRHLWGGAALALTWTTLSACGAAAVGAPSASSANYVVGTSTAFPPNASGSSTQTATTAATVSSAPAGNGAPSPTKQTITEADSGKTVQLRVGDVLIVALRAPEGYQNWQLAVPDARLLMPMVNPAAAAARGVTLRSFRAAGAGQTDLTATTIPACATGPACPRVVRQFDVKVAVTR